MASDAARPLTRRLHRARRPVYPESARRSAVGAARGHVRMPCKRGAHGVTPVAGAVGRPSVFTLRSRRRGRQGQRYPFTPVLPGVYRGDREPREPPPPRSDGRDQLRRLCISIVGGGRPVHANTIGTRGRRPRRADDGETNTWDGASRSSGSHNRNCCGVAPHGSPEVACPPPTAAGVGFLRGTHSRHANRLRPGCERACLLTHRWSSNSGVWWYCVSARRCLPHRGVPPSGVLHAGQSAGPSAGPRGAPTLRSRRVTCHRTVALAVRRRTAVCLRHRCRQPWPSEWACGTRLGQPR